jgi:hypothetical protein
MKQDVRDKLEDIIVTYERVVRVMEHNAATKVKEEARAYGGVIRSSKGQLQEFITDEIIRTAWVLELGQSPSRLAINKNKIAIPIRMDYISTIKDETVREHILKNAHNYTYGLSVDKHVFIDGKMLMGIECKAYTENAMIKRILVDFYLLLTQVPDLHCYLFQLESQLGGDYSSTIQSPHGSKPTHTLMSYFENVRLNIVTLLPGERKVDQPINKEAFFKHLPMERLEAAVAVLSEGFLKSEACIK